MAPNDVELIRVYTADAGSIPSSVVLPITDDFDIIVEVEAGSAIFGSGTDFEVGVVVVDINAFNLIPTKNPAPAGYQVSPFNSDLDGPGSDWPTQKHSFKFQVANAVLVGRQNHMGIVYAYLKARHTDPDVSFGISVPFLLV